MIYDPILMRSLKEKDGGSESVTGPLDSRVMYQIPDSEALELVPDPEPPRAQW